MILKGLIAIGIFFIIPILLGFLILKFIEKEKNNLLLAIVLGYVVEFAICQLIAVPMIFLGASYKVFVLTFFVITILLAIISAILNYKRVKEIIKVNFESLKVLPKILTILCIILIGFQVFEYVFFTHIDDDDAFYVGTATTSIYTDTLYKYSPTTGGLSGEHLALRYRLAPFPLFLAVMSTALSMHPAIVAHVVFTAIFVPLVYIIYYLLGMTIFKENRNSALSFVLFLCILQIWGTYSVRTTFAFLLFRIWQGKAMLCNFIFPLVMLFFLKANENNFKFMYCLLLFLIMLAGNLTTTMGIGLTVIILMLLSFCFEVSKINFKNLKENNFLVNIKNMLLSLACCMPSFVYAVIYFL